jgi:hypothetical protein
MEDLFIFFCIDVAWNADLFPTTTNYICDSPCTLSGTYAVSMKWNDGVDVYIAIEFFVC